ncbi:DUF771 domain-containing protein [Salinicoccus sp. CNSTN-B1]
MNIQVTIPEDHVIITREEYEALQSGELTGKFIKMKELVAHTSYSAPWIKQNVLYKPNYQKDLEEIVYYPKNQGDTFIFKAKEMYEFLDKNFLNILREERE